MPKQLCPLHRESHHFIAFDQASTVHVHVHVPHRKANTTMLHLHACNLNAQFLAIILSGKWSV